MGKYRQETQRSATYRVLQRGCVSGLGRASSVVCHRHSRYSKQGNSRDQGSSGGFCRRRLPQAQMARHQGTRVIQEHLDADFSFLI